MASKKSIRFYNDHIVRAVWDAELSKWWFSATDVVRAINDEDDYTKAGNYWRWLKKKLATEGIQLVSGTHDFKFEAPDGKMRKADVLDNEALQLLAKHYPNNRANAGGLYNNYPLVRSNQTQSLIKQFYPIYL